MTKQEFIDDFKARVKANPKTRWWRFGIVSLIFFAWVCWLGNPWVALVWILLFDIYITGYIPFTWWKKSRNATVRTVMSWIDAIVYALILVYFIFTFIGQNYQIPSSSLEKTLLVGDYLWVNKMAYGPRVPNTPLHFPLAQNTLPILNTKSYIEKPQWTYHRLKGLGSVQRNDIVVFNFPAGDTVALAAPNGEDYYTLVRRYGRDNVRNNPQNFGEIIWRPVDRRENYVKRAVGLPGERLSIVDGVIHINGNPIDQPENVQFNYFVQLRKGSMSDNAWQDLGVAASDYFLVPTGGNDIPSLIASGFIVNEDGTIPPIYYVPLTEAMVGQLKADPNVANVVKVQPNTGDYLFPEGVADEWTRADYGEVWIPKKGETIKLTPENWQIYYRCIRDYEGNHDARLGSDGRVYIGGEPCDSYTFLMDYYFMMGDNRDNSLDSRYWGFVPEDHIVGRPERVLISFDRDKSLLSGIRWDRIFRNARN